MGILLTDREIKVAVEAELDENFFKERGFKSNSQEMFIARAQLKKVVEYLNGLTFPKGSNEDTLARYIEQALLSEVDN